MCDIPSWSTFRPVTGVKLPCEFWVENVFGRNPALLIRAVSLSLDKVFQLASSLVRSKDFFDQVGWLAGLRCQGEAVGWQKGGWSPVGLGLLV